jgi:2,3-bisphosphoglycerate-dependent phosphoglycerate mutase
MSPVRCLYLIRHCAAEGQAPDAPLTGAGRKQAERLADVLHDAGIDRIISSPFRRARESIAPLARRLGLAVDIDDRLAERVLGSGFVDWRAALRATFDDPDLCFDGGESCRVATARGVTVLEEVLHGQAQTAAIVTHGNLLALLLRHFDPRVGYAEWERLTNPDVFRAGVSQAGAIVERVWR